MFAGHRIDFHNGRRAPLAGQTLIGSGSQASGVLAFDPVVECGCWHRGTAQGFMILTDTYGHLRAGEWLRPMREGNSKEEIGQDDAIAQIGASRTFEFPDLPQPAFMIHAGDVIYYDFPKSDREPRLDSYRATYRESWFEDRFQRLFLSRGSHYMTMDDHEIVDDFATDINLPRIKGPADLQSADPANAHGPNYFEPEQYLEAARPAYEEYAHSRHPDGPLYYNFRHGPARFFVMDTRTTRRRNRYSQMIEAAQMNVFKKWLKCNKEDLKFVVSSVPFVAEVVGSEGTPPSRDHSNDSDDKWCGQPFRWQRDEIIDFIEQEAIERVVFLVGDMHCAYHASMSIGNSHRWARRTVHELAGGPINQLEFGRREQFAPVANLSTRLGRIPYQVRLHQFHGNANAVMHIQVTMVPDPRDRTAGIGVPEIAWRVIRTMTDPEAQPDSNSETRRTIPRRVMRIKDDPPISGRIRFGRRWSVDDLPAW
jgi:hypothetical protein